MNSFEHFVVATDFSPGACAAVARGVQLAIVHRASLCLLHAFDDKPRPATPTPAGHEQTGDSAMSADGIRQRLADTAAILSEQAGLLVSSELMVGAAADVIDAYAETHHPSLLLIGSRFEPGIEGLGGTALQAIRTPAWPVLIVRTAADTPYDRVISGVDLRDGSVRAAVLALALFPTAHHHILYAVAPALDRPLSMGGFTQAQVQAMHELAYQHARLELQLLARGLSAHARHPVTTDVASDEPARAILVAAATLPADCVVVGHHDPSTIGQTMLGSMAHHVVQFTAGDVLVVP
jgi:universal stress protein E